MRRLMVNKERVWKYDLLFKWGNDFWGERSVFPVKVCYTSCGCKLIWPWETPAPALFLAVVGFHFLGGLFNFLRSTLVSAILHCSRDKVSKILCLAAAVSCLLTITTIK